MADRSNLQTTTSTRPQKGGRKARNTKKNDPVPVENIPNFSSFEEYELIVQPVSPLKTHVSMSTSTTEDNWDNYPTVEAVAHLDHYRQQHLVTSSPKVVLTRSDDDFSAVVGVSSDFSHKIPRINLNRVPAVNNSSQLCTSTPQVGGTADNSKKLSGDVSHLSGSSSIECQGYHLPVSMQTRRAKRLRHLMNTSGVSACMSTPEQQYKKMSR